jgi:hypothetical protein
MTFFSGILVQQEKRDSAVKKSAHSGAPGRVARFFLMKFSKKGENKLPLNYQMAIKYIKWLKYIKYNDIFHPKSLHNLPKIGIFGLKI